MINCLVVDDEPIARKGLLEHIRQIDFLTAVADCKSASEALPWLQKRNIDLIFMDIQMPKLNGIDFIKKNAGIIPGVIFTTAYPEYAIEGYELDVLDYLVKPISFNRFLKSAVKAREFLNQKNRYELSSPDFFFLKCNQKIEKIKMNDVLFIEGMANYIIVHTLQKKYISYLTSKSIEEQLPHDLFLRIHKSFLVAILSIDTIDGNEVKIGSYTLPISKSYKDEVMNRIGNRLFKR